MANKIINLRSNKSDSNGPISPLESDIINGEIAINYSTGNETLYIKNDSGKIVAFKDEQYIKNLIYKTSITPPDSSSILELVYPIGSIYISTIQTNPSLLFGFGSWEQISDVFLIGAGDNYPNGSTGGESEHLLTVNEIPSHTHEVVIEDAGEHTHDINIEMDGKAFSGDQLPHVVDTSDETIQSLSNGIHSHNATISDTGGNLPHNNIPPYLSVYMWKRIS